MRILIITAIAAASASPLFASTAVERARTTVSEWVAAEKAISREEVDWEEEKILLHDLIAVSRAKVERLEKELAESERNRSLAGEQRAEWLDREAELTKQAAAVRNIVGAIEEQLRELRPRLPDPLLSELQAPFQRIPQDPRETSLGLGERMQTAVAILTEIRQFDGKITISEETRELPGNDGRGRFQTIWLGLGQAYYLAPGDAGFGIAGADGWEWHSRPELAGKVREAIALARQTAAEPKLIDLPVKLRKGAGK